MSKLGAAAALGSYRLFGYIVRPLVPFLLSYRARRGKEDVARIGERYGRPSQPRPAGRLVWVHAASVGETNTVIPLIEQIVAAGVSVVLTTVTVTAATIAADRLPPGAVHQYSPIDTTPWIRAFIRHWQPDCAIFVESEIWPATVLTLAAAGIPQVVVNGRLSLRSFEGWRRHKSIAHALFSRISLCLAQSERDAAHYRALGAPDVVVTGNLKFDTPAPGADAAKLAAFKAALGDRPAWVAASTHPGEEEIVAGAHRLIAGKYPDLVTIIAPRHPDRGGAIRTALTAQGFAVAQRSAGEALAPSTEIYLADTLSELGMFYRAAPIAFMGGSLVPHGGQNPIEPVRVEAAVLHGPHVHNFVDVYEAMDIEDRDIAVENADGLATAVSALVANSKLRKKKAVKARKALGPFSGALAATMEALGPHLHAAAVAAAPREAIPS